MPIDPNQAGNYYQVSNNAVWLRPHGGDNTTWMYGASAPTEGVDARAWTNVANPYAFEYGGEKGMAAQEQSRYANMGKAAQERTGPTMDLGRWNQDMFAEDRSRDAQMRALDMQEAMATGRGTVPSLAQAQLQAGNNQNIQNALTLAAQARGGGASLASAQQGAQNQAMLAGSQLNFQQGIVRAQEQQAAMQAFSQQATQMRAADLQRAGMSAQMAYQTAALEAQQRGLNQQAQLGYEAMRQGVFNSQLAAQQAGEAQNAQTGLSQAQASWAKDQANNAFYRQLIGGAITAAGTAAGGMMGGPAGAAGGNMAGSAAGSAVSDAALGSAPDNPGGASGRYRY